MFRLVKTPEGEPVFFMLCDHRACMDARRGTATVANPDDYRLMKRAFMKAAMDEGWWIDLEGIYCPFHAREMIAASHEAQERGKQVVEAAPQQVLAFGKAR